MWTKRSGNISSGDIWHFSYDETVSLLLDGVKDEKGQLLLDENNVVHIDTRNILFRALKEEELRKNGLKSTVTDYSKLVSSRANAWKLNSSLKRFCS